MPIYEYRCDDCETSFEVLQRMSDDPLEMCERCGGHLRKVLHPVAIHFKGSGFYTTDYGKGSGRRSGAADDDAGSSDMTSASSSTTDSAKSGSDATKGVGTPDKPAKTGGKAKEKQKAT